MVDHKQITRSDYKERLFAPLSSTFGVPIAFNGESDTNRISGGRTLGIYACRNHAIVIRYRDCPTSVLMTVAHEIGHATDPSLGPESFSALKPQLRSGHRSYRESVARFVDYYALRYAGVILPSEKALADELYAKHERVYKRHKAEPLRLRISELMEIAEVIAFVAKPGLMELLSNRYGQCRYCEFAKDYPGTVKPCELLAKPVADKARGRAAARRKQRRGRG